MYLLVSSMIEDSTSSPNILEILDSNTESSVDPQFQPMEWVGKGKIFKDVPGYVHRELLRWLHIPDDMQSLLPDKLATIFDIISFKFLPIQTSTHSESPTESYFSEQDPNVSFIDLENEPIPPLNLVKTLHNHAVQAMLNGKKSIQYPMQKIGSYLPFSALPFWISLHEGIEAKRSWERALIWVRKIKISSEFVCRLDFLLKHVPWKGSLSSLGSFVTITEMTSFLSHEMLTKSHVDTMLALLTVRLSESNPPNKEKIIIATTEFGQSLTSIHLYQG